MKLFTPVLFVLIAIALFFLYIDPEYVKLKELLEEQSQIDQALNRSKELQDERDKLLARYNTFPQTELDNLQKLLPDHLDNVRLILDLDSIASRYGMRVRGVSIEGDTSRTQRNELGPDTSAYESVVMSFSVTGTYDTFRNFLSDLEKSLRLVDVVGLSFSATPTGVYDYNLKVKTYWLKP
jgi:Tfp pilus assembly protein PilO